MVFYYFWGVDVRMLGFSVGGVEVWNGLEAEAEEREIDTPGANTAVRPLASKATPPRPLMLTMALVLSQRPPLKRLKCF